MKIPKNGWNKLKWRPHQANQSPQSKELDYTTITDLKHKQTENLQYKCWKDNLPTFRQCVYFTSGGVIIEWASSLLICDDIVLGAGFIKNKQNIFGKKATIYFKT